jgi:hypothetical protein
LATVVFLASLGIWYAVEHGPNGPIAPAGDTWESAVPAIAIEHGMLACAYPTGIRSSVPPLYPLIAAGLLRVTGSETGLLPPPWKDAEDCHTPTAPLSVRGTSEWPFLLTGLVAWPVLLAGLLALLAAAGRGGTRWEFLGGILIACVPAVASGFIQFFHPEDVLALGLILIALACATQGRWLAAGICIGLAVCSKQYALLSAVPLVAVAPRGGRQRFLLGSLSAAAVVLVPIGLLSGKGMLSSVLGSYATVSNGTTIVGSFGLHGAARVIVSRGLPIVLAAVLATVARRRLPSTVAQPMALVSLVTACLLLRLLFEVNLYAYYFIPAAVALIAVDIVAGRLRLQTLGWLVATTLFFPPGYEPWVLVEERAPLFVQAVLLASGLALALWPLFRIGEKEPAPDAARVLREDRGLVIANHGDPARV